MQSNVNHFALENFEGPLDFLLCLIQKDEIDIYEVPLQNLIQQFIQKLTEWQDRQLELGAEFIGTMAYFVYLKSRLLLPQQDVAPIEEELEEDPRFEIIHHLIDYCRFKQAAKDLTERQETQQACFYRGTPETTGYQRPMGIDHVSIDELTDLFKEMMRRAALPRQQIYEENWRVSDKMAGIRLLIRESGNFPLHTLFSENKSRLEMIVIFLAILELMKLGTIAVGRDKKTEVLFICGKTEED